MGGALFPKNIKKEAKTLKRQMKRIIVSAVALSLLVPVVSAPEAEAAKKPSLPKTVSVTVGKTKKVTVKGVATKKIKKTSWSVKSKKVATLSKKKKNSVTIKGKKAGKSTTLTARIKVGKKTYKKSCKVKVTKAKTVVTSAPSKQPNVTATATPGGNKATDTPAATATPAPTLRVLDSSYKNAKAPAAKSANSFPTTVPVPTVNPSTAVKYSETFEDVETGVKDTTCRTDEDLNPEGLRRWILRSFSDDNGTGKDYLEVVNSEDVPASSVDAYKLPDGVGKKVLKAHIEASSKSWQGPMLNLTGMLDGGSTYHIEFVAYSKDSVLNFNEHLLPIDGGDESYGYMPSRSTPTRWLTKKGLWTEFSYDVTVPDDMFFYGLYFQTDSGSPGDMYIDNVTVTKVGQTASVDNLVKIKDVYSDVFGIVGGAATKNEIFGANAAKFLNEQYNAVTPGNEMKPESLMDSTNIDPISLEDAKAEGLYIPEGYEKQEDNVMTYKVTETVDGEEKTVSKTGVVLPKLKFENIDKILEECHAKGLKLRGHTLVWHAQTPTYFFQKSFTGVKSSSKNTTEENMDLRQEYFVKNIMEHVLKKDLELAGGDKSKCVVYAYDVVNEYMHSAGAKGTFYKTIYGITDAKKNAGYMSSTGVSLRPKFVKDAFKWADEVCKKYDRDDVKLFYNDFNTYDCPEDEIHLIDFINEDGKICDGLGMQSHLNVSENPTPDKYAQALECFRINMPDTEIHITELDAGGEGVSDADQAVYFDQIMGALMQSKAKGNKITALVIWGLYDGLSWRYNSNPLPFNGLFSPKSSYYALIDAKNSYWTAK